MECGLRKLDRGMAARVVAVPAVLLIAAAVGISVIATGPRPSTAVQGSTPLGPTASALPAGFRQFTAPGISFLYPEDWASQPVPSFLEDSWSHRYLGFLSDGLPECWSPPSPLATGAGAAPCIENGQVPGTLQLHVSEYTRPVPGEANYHRPISFGASPTYEIAPGIWYATDPAGGIYELTFSAPSGEIDGRRDEIVALIQSITFSAWDRPMLPSRGGRIELATAYGTFSYPDDWATYRFMPWYVNMVGTGPILLFASRPVEPCIPVEQCHLRQAPDGAVLIQVSWVMSAMGPPNWSEADARIGGRPAISGASSIDHRIQYLDWMVQADDEGFAELDFQVAMRADSGAVLQPVLDEFLAGIDLLQPAPSGTP
jgi:hypothetical protein